MIACQSGTADAWEIFPTATNMRKHRVSEGKICIRLTGTKLINLKHEFPYGMAPWISSFP